MIAQEKGRWDWGTFGLLTPVKILRLAFAIFLLCCYFCFASTSTSEAVLMDYGDMRGGGCSASGVCAAPRCCYVLLWLSLLLMFCTLCSSVTYYILTYTT